MTTDSNSSLGGRGIIASGGGKSMRAPAIDDAQMEIIMGRLLQVGVFLSASVMLVGGVMYLFAHAGARPDYRVFVASRAVLLRHPGTLLRGLAQGDAASIVRLGILLLVATPICRVIFAVIAFAVERDRLYVGISLTVLAVLLFGMLRGS